jgi:transcriptional regulator with XRE-family HTH domain
MTERTRRLTGTLVHLPLPRVNTLRTVDDGERLRLYIDARWKRRDGGMRGFAKRLGVAPDTLYGYFRGDHPVDLAMLARIADVLEVKRYEVVAALDGASPAVPLGDEMREALRAEIEAVLDERLGPRSEGRGRGAA